MEQLTLNQHIGLFLCNILIAAVATFFEYYSNIKFFEINENPVYAKLLSYYVGYFIIWLLLFVFFEAFYWIYIIFLI